MLHSTHYKQAYLKGLVSLVAKVHGDDCVCEPFRGMYLECLTVGHPGNYPIQLFVLDVFEHFMKSPREWGHDSIT